MINRPDYIKRIKPFIGLEPVKVLTGLRRSGKSVMLKLIQDELVNDGVPETNIISFNFESMNTPRDVEALHKEIAEKISSLHGKIFIFFDEIQEVQDWEKCINSLRVEYDCDISTSLALMPSCYRVNLRLILQADTLSSSSILSRSESS